MNRSKPNKMSEQVLAASFYETLFNLLRILGEQNDFEEVIRLITIRALNMFNADIILLMLVNPKTRQAVKTIFKEGPEGDTHHHKRLHQVLTGWVLDHKKSFISSDLRSDTRFRSSLFRQTKIKSAICVPIRSEGMIVGSLLIMNRESSPPFQDTAFHRARQFATAVSPFVHHVQKIQEYFTQPLPEDVLLVKYKSQGLLGSGERFLQLLRSMEAAARCDVRVLLQKESGTGKELISRCIHSNSRRCDKKFVAIDCGAIPVSLIESELFGHVKGAFTGAASDRVGLFELADGGTLFMDEISNLPLEMQAKLLRVLQEEEIRPLGSNESRKIDVRIISASSASLYNLVEKGEFREDLYYRLHVYPIDVPALRDRREDIPVLAGYFLNRFAAQQEKIPLQLHPGMLDFMLQRKWPGNIRELENFVERLLTIVPSEAEIIDTQILPVEFKKEYQHLRVKQADAPVKTLQAEISEYENRLIRQALEQNDWNQSQAARSLSISEHSIRYKMKKYGIVHPM